MNAISLLKEDHRRISALFEDFEDAPDKDRISIAAQICELITLHALIEEELLYPVARQVLDAEDGYLMDEARIEHGSIAHLTAQIEASCDAGDLFQARVVVLGEYVDHHVAEEESQLFPLLEAAGLDLDALGDSLAARRIQLMTELGISSDDVLEPDMATSGAAGRDTVAA
jgi:hemerythrin superfamily protein